MNFRKDTLRNNPQAKWGFSLIEVVLTLVILGLLMSLVTVNLRRDGTTRSLKSELSHISLLIEDLRTISLSTHRELSLQDYLKATLVNNPELAFYNNLSDLSQSSHKRRVRLAQTVSLIKDVIIRPPGACTFGEGQFYMNNEHLITFVVHPINCYVEIK